jgi:hypothetical protein
MARPFGKRVAAFVRNRLGDVANIRHAGLSQRTYPAGALPRLLNQNGTGKQSSTKTGFRCRVVQLEIE